MNNTATRSSAEKPPDVRSASRPARPAEPVVQTWMPVASGVPTATIVAMFYFDAMDKATPPPSTVTYFESWPADRSVEESLAAIREYQKKKDAMRAREREAYKALGSAVGMDVETLDAEAQKDEADRRAKAEADIAARVGASK